MQSALLNGLVRGSVSEPVKPLLLDRSGVDLRSQKFLQIPVIFEKGYDFLH